MQQEEKDKLTVEKINQELTEDLIKKDKEELLKEKVKLDARNKLEECLKADGFMILFNSKHLVVETPIDTRFRLDHSTTRVSFSSDDIMQSVDACVTQLGVKLEPAPIVVVPPKVETPRKPLKIAIITHFNQMQESYSPAKAVKNQIKILQKFGHEVVFFTQEGSTVDVGCEMRAKVPKFKRVKGVINSEAKQKMIDMLREELTNDFDLAITHDFYLDDCITYREAIKECGVDIPWLHWARSGVGHKIDCYAPNTHWVYMNYADTQRFSNNISVPQEDIRVVFNEKDPSLFFKWDPITTMISNRMRLWEKDIIQTYPICTTRMDAKGLNEVLKVFSCLKRLGKKVCLVICNSNGRKRIEEINAKIEYAKTLGLVHGEDFIFTNQLANEEYQIESEIPNKVVAELLLISNLFIFPTVAEVCSNILLEASMSKNLLVLNSDLPNLFDFADSGAVLSYPFSSNISLHYQSKDQESYDRLTKQIIGQLESNKSDRQFRHVWSKHNLETIYRDMLEPVIYELIK